MKCISTFFWHFNTRLVQHNRLLALSLVGSFQVNSDLARLTELFFWAEIAFDSEWRQLLANQDIISEFSEFKK